jgi:uncharacterized membrane protein YhaH (DUF805 family)
MLLGGLAMALQVKLWRLEKMGRKPRRTFLTVFLFAVLVLSIFVFLTPNVHAEQMTTQQKTFNL